MKDRNKLSTRISELARDWRLKISGDFPGKYLTVLLDGWKNPVNGQSHMCYILSDRNRLFYLKSVVVTDKTALNLFAILREIVHEVTDAGGSINGAVGDNAANIQLSLKMLNQENPRILTGRCVAHILNLLVGDVFWNIATVKATLTIVDQLIKDKKITTLRSDSLEFTLCIDQMCE